MINCILTREYLLQVQPLLPRGINCDDDDDFDMEISEIAEFIDNDVNIL
jgi:hypothetical protein